MGGALNGTVLAIPSLMKSSTRNRSNYNRTEKFRSRIWYVYYMARTNHTTHEVQLEHIGKVWDEVNAVSTQSEKSYLFGYSMALSQIQGLELVEWRLGHASGPVARGHVWADGYNPDNGGPTHGSHFWKGTDKLFGEWKSLTDPSLA